MEIKKLHLKNFRNYKDEEIYFSGNVNLIFGENAQGKTNIIEALYLFATGKSHRTNNINELVRYGENYFTIMLEFEEREYQQSIKIKYEKGKGKELLINEVKKEKISELLGVVPAVLFAPESLSYVKGSPGERRKFLDIVLCQTEKKYLYSLQKYNRIVRNKNVLLKQLQVWNETNEQLEVWNESQAREGSIVIEARNDFIHNLEARMDRLLFGISNGKENIRIKYRSNYEEGKSIYEGLMGSILKNREKEIEQGSCIIGPHRDDLEIFVNQKNSRVYCSQGQQRSVALALNIAVMEEIEERTEKAPILLLDDVMSELDDERRKFLLKLIENKQTIITTTEIKEWKETKNRNISYIHIANGRIEKIVDG